MTGLMQRVACRLAASSCCCDQSAHIGSFSTRSRSTLVSTRVNELVLTPAPGERHDLVGTHLHRRDAAQTSKAAHGSLAFAFAMAQYHISSRCELEVNGRAGLNPEQIANLFWNRDLPFRSYRGCHL